MSPSPYLVGLVGQGVGPSLTPALHMAEGRANGLDYVYRAIDLNAVGLAPDRIGEILTWARTLGFNALNITHPCKQLVIPHLDALDDDAAALGAVNTVVFEPHAGAQPSGEGHCDRTVGYNTDAPGFGRGFVEGLPGAVTTNVVLLGAGGAGAAVGHALLDLGAEHLTVVDLDVDRAVVLAEELAARHRDARVDASAFDKLSILLPHSDGVVHCTPTGMADHPGMPFDAALLHPGLWVADIVYRPLDTALLTAARRAGCRTLDGGYMAVHQASIAFELITGITPDTGRMSRHFRTLAEQSAMQTPLQRGM
ncbi:shikimate dehydrogenase [Mycolicibacterium mengxianglii]|uniref:shikimate dehydrogenase n=1 Tax=Mycolicibacterium mengxianglii TaxID=2736649 RepID=UPI0018D11002|nr:shikimate dehydrogenase [Mycolicibacterium mengxianglii]